MDDAGDFSVGGTLRRLFSLSRRRAGVILASSFALYALPVSVIAYLLIGGGIPGANALRGTDAPHTAVQIPMQTFGASLAVTLVNALGFAIALEVVIGVALDGVFGRPVDVAAALAVALRSLPAAIVTYVLAAVATCFAGLLIVPGVMLFCRWSVALPTLVVEQAGIWARSAAAET